MVSSSMIRTKDILQAMQIFDKLPVSFSLPPVNNFVLLLEILNRYRKNSSPQEFTTIPNQLLRWE